MRAESPDVVVVGAGLSGLITARELAREGLEVLALEARDRPGGRTHAIEVDGVSADLGGEWVDEAHTAMRDLTGELGIKLIPTGGGKKSGRWFVRGEWSDSMPLSSRDAKVHGLMEEAMAEVAAGKDPRTYWRDVPEDDASVEDWLVREGMSEAGLHVVGALLSSCGSTVPLKEMSFFAYANKAATRGGPGRGNEYRVAGGAGKISEKLAEGLGGVVRYSSPVVEVSQDGGGATVRYVAENGVGEARARKVVIAVPFPCYREIRFDPAPPAVFRRMFAGARYGVVRKMHFVFDREIASAPFTLTDTALGYCCASRAGGGSGMITSFAGGEALLPEVGRSEEERKRRGAREVQKLYDVPEPAKVVEKVWAHDHWARGSYMILSPGDLADFGEAMGGSFGNVHLAGAEAMAAAPSFMNSAVESGKRAAEKVMEILTSKTSRKAQ